MDTPRGEENSESPPAVERGSTLSPVVPADSAHGDGPPPADDVEARLRRRTRRDFALAAVSLAAGYGAWKWLTSREPDRGLAWPLRRVLEVNENLARALFSPTRRATEFPASQALDPRVNGMIGIPRGGDPGREIASKYWSLSVDATGPGSVRRRFHIDDIRALPRFEQTTELKCIEGWSTIVHWAGARLGDLAATTGLAARSGQPYDPARPPAELFKFVALATPDGGYYVGLDSPSALHPQTLLAYEMNGQPLTIDHGAPLRLVIPVKYGIKNIKNIGSITFTDRRPADYWAELGYDWYAGH